MTNRFLKAQIVLNYGSQVAFCASCRFSEFRLSRIIQGYIEPSSSEKKILEREFGEEIFACSPPRQRRESASEPPQAA